MLASFHGIYRNSSVIAKRSGNYNGFDTFVFKNFFVISEYFYIFAFRPIKLFKTRSKWYFRITFHYPIAVIWPDITNCCELKIFRIMGSYQNTAFITTTNQSGANRVSFHRFVAKIYSRSNCCNSSASR